jgi:hypothetical protein
VSESNIEGSEASCQPQKLRSFVTYEQSTGRIIHIHQTVVIGRQTPASDEHQWTVVDQILASDRDRQIPSDLSRLVIDGDFEPSTKIGGKTETSN